MLQGDPGEQPQLLQQLPAKLEDGAAAGEQEALLHRQPEHHGRPEEAALGGRGQPEAICRARPHRR